MAVTDAYATPQQYRDRLHVSDDLHDAELYEELLAISRYIERKLLRFFTKDTAALARPFYSKSYGLGDPDAENPWLHLRRKGAQPNRFLDIDDLASTTGLIVKIDHNRTGSFTGETPLAATDYQLFPLNADKGPEPEPWTRVYLPSWSSELNGWPPGSPVEITGRWGWPSVPRAIIEATVQFTALWRLESPRATSRIQEGIDGAIETSREGQRILADLIKNYRKAEQVI